MDAWVDGWMDGWIPLLERPTPHPHPHPHSYPRPHARPRPRPHQVIHALAERSRSEQQHCPFRNSALTRLLQESLGGNCKTSLLVCISPGLHDASETKGSLHFGSRAMQVRNVATINCKRDFKALAEELAAQLEAKTAAWARREAGLDDALRAAHAAAAEAEARAAAAAAAEGERVERELAVRVAALRAQLGEERRAAESALLRVLVTELRGAEAAAGQAERDAEERAERDAVARQDALEAVEAAEAAEAAWAAERATLRGELAAAQLVAGRHAHDTPQPCRRRVDPEAGGTEPVAAQSSEDESEGEGEGEDGGEGSRRGDEAAAVAVAEAEADQLVHLVAVAEAAAMVEAAVAAAAAVAIAAARAAEEADVEAEAEAARVAIVTAAVAAAADAAAAAVVAVRANSASQTESLWTQTGQGTQTDAAQACSEAVKCPKLYDRVGRPPPVLLPPYATQESMCATLAVMRCSPHRRTAAPRVIIAASRAISCQTSPAAAVQRRRRAGLRTLFACCGRPDVRVEPGGSP